MTRPPQADPAEIYRALNTILLPGQVTELRAIRAIAPPNWHLQVPIRGEWVEKPARHQRVF